MNERGQYGHNRHPDLRCPPTAFTLVKKNLPFTLVAVAVMGAGVVAIMRQGTR